MFGFVQALGPAIISELFGLAHFATTAAFVSTTFIVSSFGVAAMLTNWSYQHGKSGDGRECHGRACFGLAFVICSVLGMVTVVCSIVLTMRRRKYYKRMFRCAAYILCLFTCIQALKAVARCRMSAS